MIKNTELILLSILIIDSYPVKQINNNKKEESFMRTLYTCKTLKLDHFEIKSKYNFQNNQYIQYNI